MRSRCFWGLLAMVFAACVAVGRGPLPHMVARDDLGVPGRQPHLSVSDGDYRYPEKDIPSAQVPADSPARTVAFHGTELQLSYHGLLTDARYVLRLTFLSDSDSRRQQLFLAGRETGAPMALRKAVVKTLLVPVPVDLSRKGEVTLGVRKLTGPNAVLSVAELWSDKPALRPAWRLSVEAQGSMLRGWLTDANTGQGAPGENIGITGPAGTETVFCRTDRDGRFERRVPQGWLRRSDGVVRVRTTASGITAAAEVPVADLATAALPRLTPAPSGADGVPARVCLDGAWKFNPALPATFPPADARRDWGDIEVPGEWVMQGYEVAPAVAAGYVRDFDVPAEWRGQRVKLRFDGVFSESTVFVNGRRAGGHLGGFTPFELDVTDLVRFKAGNTLGVSVRSDSIADRLASASKYACHPLGGVSRSVWLFSVPPVNIADICVRTTFDDAFTNAELEVNVEVANEGDGAAAGLRGTLSLRPWRQKDAVELDPDTIRFPDVAAGDVVTGTVRIPVAGPRQWNCETPNLYVLRCELRSPEGVLETVATRFGFRQVSVAGNQLLINGRPVKLRGVNRHEVHPLRGRSLPAGLRRRDVALFRAANVNHIRTCHYPPGEELLEAADELGMFVEEEAPFCWAHQTKGDPALIRRAVVRQTMEMIVRDRNHPSVIYWSLANESRWNDHFAASGKAARAADPTRPRTFNYFPWGGGYRTQDAAICAIGTDHYPGLGGADKYADCARPVCFGEYAHLNAYNRVELVTDPVVRDRWGGYLRQMWEGMEKSRGCLGGSIWSGIDDTFFYGDDQTVGYGTWGPLDGWRRPKPEYWNMAKVYSPIQIQERTLEYRDGAIRIAIENRQDFSNLERYRIAWTLLDETGTATADVPPHAAGTLIIRPATPPAAGTPLELVFHDPRGFVANRFRLPVGEKPRDPVPPPVGHAQVRRDGSTIRLEATGFHTTISTETGLLTQALAGGRTVLTGGPHLMLLPLNGSGGTQMHGKTQDYEPATATCGNWRRRGCECSDTGEGTVIRTSGDYDEASGQFTFAADAHGRLTITYAFALKRALNPRQIGLVFDLPGELNTLRWQRRGLWTVYPPDHIARLAGEARADAGVPCGPVGPRVPPRHPWALDASALGTNEFRSTKHNVFRAALVAVDGAGVRLRSAGDQHVRSWVTGQGIRFLVADYSNGGAERFLRRLAKQDDRPLKVGDRVSGTVVLELVAPTP